MPRSLVSKARHGGMDLLAAEYVGRATRLNPCELAVVDSEIGLFEWVRKQGGRSPVKVILLDSRGESWTSEEFARHLRGMRDEGVQRLVLGIGPADGWSEGGRAHADFLFSLGRITLPHQLARVVLAEQVYRALTILAGHPYHCGH